MPGQNNNSDHQLIHRFFEGELSEQEEKAVDQRIQTDPAFAEKMAQVVAAQRMARELRREELDSLYPEQPPRRHSAPLWWVWGLLVLGLAAGLYFWWATTAEPGPSSDPVALATGLSTHQQALRQEPDYFDEMGGSWKVDYREGRYAEARQKLNTLLGEADDLRNLSRFCYYAGLLNLYPQEEPVDLDRAIRYLEIAKPEMPDASLYLIIAYAKAGQAQQARAVSEELSERQIQRLPLKIQKALQ